MTAFYLRKSDGTFEPFDEKKILRSLRRSGASKKASEHILKELRKKTYDGISSSKIYSIINNLLRRKEKKAYLRYNLPIAVSRLGPEGYAFEAFLAELMKKHGWKNVFRGRKIKGKCMVHELDVLGEKENKKLTIEAKFHNSRSKKSDFQVILYMKARFEDLEKGGYYGEKEPVQMIITNTKFTDNAKRYSKCSGINVVSWNYPEDKNLHDYILEANLHPVTAISNLNKKIKEELIKRKIVTIEQLKKNDFEILNQIDFVTKKDKEKIVKEVRELF